MMFNDVPSEKSILKLGKSFLFAFVFQNICPGANILRVLKFSLRGILINKTDGISRILK